MPYDPSLIKPYADYHKRHKPKVIIKPQAYPQKPKPQPRLWKVSQYVPIVAAGLTSNGTLATQMLNLSWLPEDAEPERCLAWAAAFCDAMEGGLRAETAAEVADRAVNVKPEGKDCEAKTFV